MARARMGLNRSAMTGSLQQERHAPSEEVLPTLPLTFSGMRIGLLGGSFNPPHAGHRHISMWALKRLELDRLWWLVTPGNPLKSYAGLAAFDKRVAQAERLQQHPRIDVTGFEAHLGFIYTADTIAYLRARCPDVHFIWVMGADSLANLHLWRHWRRLMTLVPIAVIDRPGWRLKALASPAAQSFARYRVDERDAAALATFKPPAWTFLTLPLMALSSTEIRARAANG